MLADATANRVIASAKRLMDVRHVCRSNKRMAEISVPAWPIPIHHTKLIMSKAQPTGELLPHDPVPLMTNQVRARNINWKIRTLMINPTNQPRGVRRVSTNELILSVMDE